MPPVKNGGASASGPSGSRNPTEQRGFRRPASRGLRGWVHPTGQIAQRRQGDKMREKEQGKEQKKLSVEEYSKIIRAMGFSERVARRFAEEILREYYGEGKNE